DDDAARQLVRADEAAARNGGARQILVDRALLAADAAEALVRAQTLAVRLAGPDADARLADAPVRLVAVLGLRGLRALLARRPARAVQATVTARRAPARAVGVLL